MALTIDEVIAGGYGGGASPITITKSGSTSPGALTVQFTLQWGAATVVPTSVTYGGVEISVSVFDAWPAVPAVKVYYGYLLSPPSGAQDLVINYSGSAGSSLMATFWSGDASSVSWTTRASAIITPVVNIAKAASSAIASFVTNNAPASALTFLGDGVARTINPAVQYGGTQAPTEGTGSLDWQYVDPEEGNFALLTSHVSAEIIAAAAAVPPGLMGGHPQLMGGM